MCCREEDGVRGLLIWSFDYLSNSGEASKVYSNIVSGRSRNEKTPYEVSGGRQAAQKSWDASDYLPASMFYLNSSRSEFSLSLGVNGMGVNGFG